MALLPIITVPDPLLRRESLAVERIDDELRRFADDMLATMYEAPGVGLAAVQVAVPRRLIVIDTTRAEDPARNPIVMVNPRLVETIGKDLRLYEEGCLSIPEVYAEVERPATVRVVYTDLAGKTCELVCDDMMATVVQHEIDHLDGKLFIDFLSKLRRDRIIKKLVKSKRDTAPATE